MSDAQHEPAAAAGPGAVTGPGPGAEPGPGAVTGPEPVDDPENHVLGRPGAVGTRGGVLSGFVVAGTGLVKAVRTERNLRIQLAVGGAAIGVGGWLGLAATQWAILLLTIGLVITTELVNTALESTVDLVTVQFHPWRNSPRTSPPGRPWSRPSPRSASESPSSGPGSRRSFEGVLVPAQGRRRRRMG